MTEAEAQPPETVPSTDAARKLAAKRVNESLKHFNALLNTLAAGVLGAVAILPFIRNENASLDPNALQWCAIGVGLHTLPYVLNFLIMRWEE